MMRTKAVLGRLGLYRWALVCLSVVSSISAWAADGSPMAPMGLFGNAPANVAEIPEMTGPSLMWAQALQQFRQRGFDVLMAEANAKGAEGDLSAAGRLANPSLSVSGLRTYDGYDLKQCGGPGCSRYGFAVGVSDSGALSDLIYNRRGLRVDAARAALQASRFGRDDTQRQAEYLLKSQWLSVAVDQAQLQFAREAEATFSQSTALQKARLEAGDIGEADYDRVWVMALQAQQQVDAILQQFLLDRASLAFLLGEHQTEATWHVDTTWLTGISAEALTTSDPAQLCQLALHHRPDVLVQQQNLLQAKSELRQARRLWLPDFSWDVSYQQQGQGTFAITPPTWGLTLNVALPVLNQFQGEAKRADANVRQATLALTKIERQTESDVSSAQQALRLSYSQFARSKDLLVPQAARILSLVNLQYNKGAASLLDLLDAQRTFLAVNVEYFGLLAQLWSAVFALEQAVFADLAAIKGA